LITTLESKARDKQDREIKGVKTQPISYIPKRLYNLKVTSLYVVFKIRSEGKNNPNIQPKGEGGPKSKNKYKSIKHKEKRRKLFILTV